MGVRPMGMAPSSFPAPNVKRTINFGDSSADNNTSYSRVQMSKDAPTIGNPLMMRMEF